MIKKSEIMKAALAHYNKDGRWLKGDKPQTEYFCHAVVYWGREEFRCEFGDSQLQPDVLNVTDWIDNTLSESDCYIIHTYLERNDSEYLGLNFESDAAFTKRVELIQNWINQLEQLGE